MDTSELGWLDLVALHLAMLFVGIGAVWVFFVVLVAFGAIRPRKDEP